MCDLCGFLTSNTENDDTPEGFSVVSLFWNLSNFHAEGFPDKDKQWELCWDCTLKLREFFGIPRDGMGNTEETRGISLDYLDGNVFGAGTQAFGKQRVERESETQERIPKFKGDPFDYIDRHAYDEVAHNASLHAGPIIESDFYSEVARREREMRMAARPEHG